MDCGCTITCTRLGGKLNKRHASITSNPLFIKVAESMVIRCPIFHVGWFSACSTVIAENSDFGVLRNGPPEAVSQMRSHFLHSPAPQALVDGIVFAVDRQQAVCPAAAPRR